MSKKIIMLCQACSWKKIYNDDKIDLFELKNDSMSSKKYRCPNCGRAIVPRTTLDPQKELDLKKKKEKLKEDITEFLKNNLDFQKNFLEEKND